MISVLKGNYETIVWCSPNEKVNTQKIKQIIRTIKEINKDGSSLPYFNITIRCEGNYDFYFTIEGRVFYKKIIKYITQRNSVFISYQESAKSGYCYSPNE